MDIIEANECLKAWLGRPTTAEEIESQIPDFAALSNEQKDTQVSAIGVKTMMADLSTLYSNDREQSTAFDDEDSDVEDGFGGGEVDIGWTILSSSYVNQPLQLLLHLYIIYSLYRVIYNTKNPCITTKDTDQTSYLDIHGCKALDWIGLSSESDLVQFEYITEYDGIRLTRKSLVCI